MHFSWRLKIKQNIYAICEECDEAISNPICPNCLERQAIAWLMERKKETLVIRVKDRMDLIKRQSNSSKSNVNCVICKNKLSICPHCTSNEILKALNKEKKLSNDFLRLFNYID